MKTFQDFEREIMLIREAIDDLTVKGERNAQLIVYSISKCNAIIDTLRQIESEAAQNQNGEKEKPQEVTEDVEDIGSAQTD